MIEILDVETNKKTISPHDISFPELKKRVLVQHINEQRNLGNFNIDLGSFDLTGLDLKDVNFSDTVLSRENFDVIVAGGGNLRGAKLAQGTDVTHLQIDGMVLDKTMARSLIDAGVDFKSVLKIYLATRSDQLSQFHKASLLAQYLKTERNAKRLPINLTEFDLSNINFKNLNLSGTVISRANLIAIIADSGNLTGAILAAGTDVANVNLADVRMNKAMALQLIAAGAHTRAVLINYLATEHGLKRVNIDIGGIDVSMINSRGIDLLNVNLTGIQFAPAPTSTNEYKKKVRANFDHDLLTMLSMYSQTTAAILLKSYTKDDLISAPDQTYDTHEYVIETHVRSYFSPGAKCAKTAIKTSSGNCGEMAVMCKQMLDLYLRDSLASLGYQGFNIKTYVAITDYPSDHNLVRLDCTFQGITKSYYVDPWSGGKAWTLEDGMRYFKNKPADRYTQPGTKFRVNHSYNNLLNNYVPSIRPIFNHFKVKEQLDLTIKKNKAGFLGLPIR